MGTTVPMTQMAYESEILAVLSNPRNKFEIFSISVFFNSNLMRYVLSVCVCMCVCLCLNVCGKTLINESPLY